MNESTKVIFDYLQVVSQFGQRQKEAKGWPYGSIEDFILSNGQSFERDFLTGQEEVPRGQMQQCYKNTFDLCLHDPMFSYVEGYAVARDVPLPLMHAWAVTPGGNVVDPTWKHGVAYFGVKLPLWYCTQVVCKTQKWGVLDAWTLGFPLLTGEHIWPLVRKEVKL